LIGWALGLEVERALHGVVPVVCNLNSVCKIFTVIDLERPAYLLLLRLILIGSLGSTLLVQLWLSISRLEVAIFNINALVVVSKVCVFLNYLYLVSRVLLTSKSLIMTILKEF